MDSNRASLEIASDPRYFWYPFIAGGLWMGLGFGALLSGTIMLLAHGGWDVFAITWLVPVFGVAWSVPQSLWWRRVLGATHYDFCGDVLTIHARGKAPAALSLVDDIDAVRLTGSPPRILDIVLDKGSMAAFPCVDLLCNGEWIYGPKFAASAQELDVWEAQIAAALRPYGVRFSRT